MSLVPHVSWTKLGTCAGCDLLQTSRNLKARSSLLAAAANESTRVSSSGGKSRMCMVAVPVLSMRSVLRGRKSNERSEREGGSLFICDGLGCGIGGIFAWCWKCWFTAQPLAAASSGLRSGPVALAGRSVSCKRNHSPIWPIASPSPTYGNRQLSTKAAVWRTKSDFSPLVGSERRTD